MKQLTVLMFLFPIAFNLQADVALTYKNLINTNGAHHLTYYVKNGLLRLSEEQSRRINLYNQAKQVFISIDEQNGNISRIDRHILDKRVEQLNQQRLAHLSQVEAELARKLPTMTRAEQEVGEELVNQLKYPEFYGLHTQIKVKQTNNTKTINGITCQVYDIKRKEQLLRQICMASRESLNLSEADYLTLRNFHQFNYATQTRIMLAMGKTDFLEIDYQLEKMPGLPVEVIGLVNGRLELELLLDNLSKKPLPEALFAIPNTQN